VHVPTVARFKFLIEGALTHMNESPTQQSQSPARS